MELIVLFILILLLALLFAKLGIDPALVIIGGLLLIVLLVFVGDLNFNGR